MHTPPKETKEIVLIGHPFAPSGMGQLIRSAILGFRAAGIPFQVLDCHGYFPIDPTLNLSLTHNLGTEINLFCINGDEVEDILTKFGPPPKGSYNIIYPAWELSKYPDKWAQQLERFEEIWGMSTFVTESIRASVRRPVYTMPLAVAPTIQCFHPRISFNLPGSSLVFLFTFDCTSFSARKNPWAVIEAFKKARKARPSADIRLVVKVSNGDRSPETITRIRTEMDELGDYGRIIEKRLDSDEILSLVASCDCLISLHRSEGFGFTLAEAMFFGKPVIGTAYSGNLDFMTHHSSFPVDYHLVKVKENEYPFGEGQEWAHPDINNAKKHMLDIIDDPMLGPQIGNSGKTNIRTHFSPLARGLAYRSRIRLIQEQIG